jgi:hypothetical protein
MICPENREGSAVRSDWRDRVAHWEADLTRQLAWLEELRRRADAIEAGQKSFDFSAGEAWADAQASARMGG